MSYYERNPGFGMIIRGYAGFGLTEEELKAQGLTQSEALLAEQKALEEAGAGPPGGGTYVGPEVEGPPGGGGTFVGPEAEGPAGGGTFVGPEEVVPLFCLVGTTLAAFDPMTGEALKGTLSPAGMDWSVAKSGLTAEAFLQGCLEKGGQVLTQQQAVGFIEEQVYLLSQPTGGMTITGPPPPVEEGPPGGMTITGPAPLTTEELEAQKWLAQQQLNMICVVPPNTTPALPKGGFFRFHPDGFSERLLPTGGWEKVSAVASFEQFKNGCAENGGVVMPKEQAAELYQVWVQSMVAQQQQAADDAALQEKLLAESQAAEDAEAAAAEQEMLDQIQQDQVDYPADAFPPEPTEPPGPLPGQPPGLPPVLQPPVEEPAEGTNTAVIVGAAALAALLFLR